MTCGNASVGRQTSPAAPAQACGAARAAAHPRFPLSAVAAERREAAGGLGAFARPGTTEDIDAVSSWSLGAVSPVAGRLLQRRSGVGRTLR
ncbi:hypothetical protein AB0M86_12630 [Streptomyces sp. NPDC051639]|uniref:hypothetical protein n=1 Tax=Streptomyces sp. NPDC051639 TaxID=3155671 RepID=UPI0034494CCD